MADEKVILEDGRVIREDIKYTGVRKAIGNTFVECASNKPMTSSYVRCDMGAIIEYRKKLKAEGHKVSMTAIFMKIAQTALEKCPVANSELDGNRIHVFENKNIAIAIAGPNDLLYTPVVRNVEKKNVLEVDEELNALIEKVQNGTLGFEDMSGATFTVSNLGNSDVCFTTQLFGPGSCILGIGATRQEFVPDENGNPVLRPLGYLTITVDHRVILGSHATAFYRALIEACQDPAGSLGLE